MQSADEKQWHDFVLGDLATIHSGHDIYAQERFSGNTPYVTAGSKCNGIGYFVGNDNDSMATDSISVARNGAIGEAHYHPYKALYGNDCRRVVMSGVCNPLAQLFIAQCISNQRSTFSYSRKLGTGRLQNLHILLPVADSGEPDYEYMTEYVRKYREAMLKRYREYVKQRLMRIGVMVDISALNEKDWAEFTLGDLFTIGAGKRLETRNKIPGSRPFIGASDNGNGVTGFVGNDNVSKDGNVLGVNYNGAPCIAFYHPYECLFTDDVKRLHLKNRSDNQFVLLFFSVVFVMQRVKYSYGYKFNEQRMKRQKLMLPVTDSGIPDWDYMEQYARNMMICKYRAYLDYLEA